MDAEDLTLNQSASLAAIIKAPSNYAPHISPQTIARDGNTSFLSWQKMVLSRRRKNRQRLTKVYGCFAQEAEKQLYSWYIDEALRESAELLGLSADEVIQGGFRIYTAYDARLQTIADEVYADSSFFPAAASDGTPIQSAMAVVDTNNGAVLAMIGGRDYTCSPWAEPRDANAPSARLCTETFGCLRTCA
ncbi:MAG: hypothetical protein ACLR4A_04635 [Christensenellales bacterium]